MNSASVLSLAISLLALSAYPQTIDDLSKVENNPPGKPPAEIVPGPASTPAASLDSIMVRPGFQVGLFASEPLIQNPFAMAFDHRGLLWIAEALDYPSTLTTDPFGGGDRIKILEDTDGDGKADKATVFADHLNLVSGLALVPEGVVLGMAPDIVLMTDKDGDDKADEKKILYTGFGRGDTHGVLSNFQYGMDDWVYATVGLAGVKLDTLGNVLNGMCRFKADGTRLEWVGNFPNNTWGLGINEAGQIFGSTANGQHAVYEAIADRYYRAAGKPPKIPQYQSNSTSRGVIWSLDHFIMEPITKSVLKVDFQTEFTANTNAEVYTAREFPREYWNRATFACEPTGHLCHTDWQEPKGSAFTAKSGRNFFASKDPWTAPIAARVGPRGELFVMDWYDPIVQHNCWAAGQSCGIGSAYQSAHRDKQYGRIYRVSYTAATPAPIPDLKDGALSKLVAALKHPNKLWRMQAQRLLIRKNDKASWPLLAELLNDRTVDDAGVNGGVAHALWTLGAMHAFDAAGPLLPAAYALASHPSYAVRMALLDVLPRTQASMAVVTGSGLLYDANPHVRLKAVLTLTEMPRSAIPIKVVASQRDLDQLSKDADSMLVAAQPTQVVNEIPPVSVASKAPQANAVLHRTLFARDGMLRLEPLIGISRGVLRIFDPSGSEVARMQVLAASEAIPFHPGSGVFRYLFTGANGDRAFGPILSVD